MKILFVDNSADLQQKWIEPLRADGWGALRARSAEDADRMLSFHGDSIELVVVGESFVSWAESHEYLFAVLTQTWGEKEVLTHQNSNRSAFFYQAYQGRTQDLLTAIRSYRKGGAPSPTQAIVLEEISGVLTRPEKTKMDSSAPGVAIKLDAPSVFFGEQSKSVESNADLKIEMAPPIEMAPASVSTPISVEGIELNLSTLEPDAKDDRTVVIDSTKLEFVAPSEQEVQAIDFAEELDPDANEGDEEAFAELIPEENISYVEAVGESPVAPVNVARPAPTPSVATHYVRDQDVAVLSGQVRSSQERIQQLEAALRVEKARASELQHMVQRQEKQIHNYENEKQVDLEVLHRQVDDLNQQLQDRKNKAHSIEAKLKITTNEVNQVKDRVRVDIRRIRVREKELESQLEILKKDSSALLQARDEKILELKRKIDLLEFNMELIQEQYQQERQSAEDLRTRLHDAARAMRQAGGLLEQ